MMANDTISVATYADAPRSLYDTVGEVAATYCGQHFPAMRAALMIGSMGRGEATWERTVDGWRVLGDAEFVLVFDDGDPGAETAERFCSSVGATLKRLGIECAVDVSVVGTRWLSRLPKTIFTYEIRNASRVIYGSSSVLGEIPSFAASEINTEDAWRLLNNRLVEWVGLPAQGDQQMYRSVKLVLDAATALLVYKGAYVPSYQARCAELPTLSAKNPATWPFSHAEFISLVGECTRFKLGHGPRPSDAALREAPRYAISLLELLAYRTPGRALTSRLRGWAVVVRGCGFLLTCRNCVRWISLAMKATPRELIYSAARHVVRIQISGLRDEGHLKSIRATLPVTDARNLIGMEELSRDIAWNYRKFVERTRA